MTVEQITAALTKLAESADNISRICLRLASEERDPLRGTLLRWSSALSDARVAIQTAIAAAPNVK